VPSWSRDGKWVYFYSNRSGQTDIWRVPAQGGEAGQFPAADLMLIENFR
jgi:Tol biopolymer transport system component